MLTVSTLGLGGAQVLRPALLSRVNATQLTWLSGSRESLPIWSEKSNAAFLTQSRNIPAIPQQLCSDFLVWTEASVLG